MRRKTWLALAAGGALLLGLAAGGALIAQAGEDDEGLTFLDRVAQKLGIETQTLEQAVEDARNDEIDERVQDGDLTQEEADRLKQKLDELPQDGGFGFGFRGGPGGPHGNAPGGWAFAFRLGAASEALAGFLGIEEAQLREELRADDATLATVAEAHGKSRDELKIFMSGQLRTRLDEAVANENLTQERANQIIERFNENLDDLIDRRLPRLPGIDRMPLGEFEGGGFRDGPGLLFKLGAGLLDLPGNVADFLGISTEQLLEELMADDATLATVAEAHGQSRDDLKAFLTTEVQAGLDEAVADGDLTQERADDMLERFNEHIDDIIDFGLPGLPFGGDLGFGFKELEGGEFEFEGGGFRFRLDVDPDDPGDAPDSEEPPTSGADGTSTRPLTRALFR